VRRNGPGEVRRDFMLTNKQVMPTLPATDVKRAKQFYEEKLGLKTVEEDEGGVLLKAGANTMLYLYKRSATKADHTVAAFDVEDIEYQVNELKSRGVRFEDYNLPDMGIKTENSIATMPMGSEATKAAWFKDSEGNILGIQQLPRSMQERQKARMAAAMA